MSKKRLLILWVLGASISFLAGIFLDVPGYMDAEYYYAGGINLVEGRGFQEDYIWNYLGDPPGLPYPSHTYWMPLPALLSALGMKLGGDTGFFWARLPFFILAGWIPIVTAWIGFRLSKNSGRATLAGILSTVPGFYLAYTGLTETFTPYLLLGGSFFLLAFSEGWRLGFANRMKLSFILGLIAGAMHLTRADGVLWLFGALVVVLWCCRTYCARKRYLVILAGVTLVSYLAVTGLWYSRNLAVFNTPMPPGGSRTLWLTEYDDTFIYPGERLTISNWWQSGLDEIIAVRISAVGSNLGTALGVQGSIFLLPLMIIGGIRYRRQPLLWFALGMWAITFLVMSFVFPFAGARGGFLHSGAAIQTVLWALIPEGLLGFAEWGVRTRKNWQLERAQKGFGFLLIAVNIFFSLAVFYGQVYGEDPDVPVWRKSYVQYTQMREQLLRLGYQRDTIVMVNNPPGFYLATGFSAIVIPNNDLDTMVEVAEKYGATVIVVEENIVKPLAALIENPANYPGIRLTYRSDEWVMYEIMP